MPPQHPQPISVAELRELGEKIERAGQEIAHRAQVWSDLKLETIEITNVPALRLIDNKLPGVIAALHRVSVSKKG